MVMAKSSPLPTFSSGNNRGAGKGGAIRTQPIRFKALAFPCSSKSWK